MINLTDLSPADRERVASLGRHFDRVDAPVIDRDADGRLVVIGAMHGQAVAFTWVGAGWIETDSPAAREG